MSTHIAGCVEGSQRESLYRRECLITVIRTVIQVARHETDRRNESVSPSIGVTLRRECLTKEKLGSHSDAMFQFHLRAGYFPIAHDLERNETHENSNHFNGLLAVYDKRRQILNKLHVSRVRLTSGGVGGLRQKWLSVSIRQYNTVIHIFSIHIKAKKIPKRKNKS